MKTSLLLQGLVLVTGTVAQTQRQRYTAVCNGLDGQSKTFDDGYEITYFCRKNGIVASLLTTQTAMSPDDCATACKDYPGCKGSSWLYTSNQCQIFGEAGAGEAVRATVFMRRDSLSDEPEVEHEASDCEETEHALRDCEETEQELTEELEECRNSQQQCSDETEECRDELAHVRETCAAEALQAERDALPKCPSIHDKTIQSGGKSYRAWCNHRLGTSGKIYKQNDLNFDKCLEECARENKCKGIQWYVNAGARCKLIDQSTGSPGALVTTMLVSLHKL